MEQGLASVSACFEELTDPRTREPTYPLINIVTIAICAVICGADDFTGIADYGRRKKDWLGRFLDLSDGIPSHDTFNTVLGALRSDVFEKCLLKWITSLHEVSDGELIAIDGKTLRRSYDRGSSKAAIHMVSAWAATNHISLGQVCVDEKSNEITAIPKLLELIEIQGAFVTIDAMGCQTAIAEKIVDEGGHYILAVKDNQPNLSKAIQAHFEDHLEDDFDRIKVSRHRTVNKDHGRIEERDYLVTPLPDDFPEASRWKNLRALGIAINNTQRNGKLSTEVRYYILDKYISAKRFGGFTRGHWGIENNLHWQLDVTFGEDACRVRKANGAANMSILRRTALSMLKNEASFKRGIKGKRLAAALDENYLEKVLFSQ